MRYSLLLFFLVMLASCASAPDAILSEKEAAAQAAVTKECLEDPELGTEWGECNIKKTIFARMPKIRSCYEKEASKKYDYHGDLILKIQVRPSGRVKEVKVEEASLKSKMLSTCAVKEIAKLKFAKPPEGINPVIYFPFALELVKP